MHTLILVSSIVRSPCRFKGKPTNHLIKQDQNGFWAINKKAFGNKSSLRELIEQFFQPVQGWPVVLKHSARASGSAGASSGAVASSSAGASSIAGAPASSPGGESEWLHGKLDKEQANAVIQGLGGSVEQGTFFVYTRDAAANEYVLCLVYKGKTTHHLLRLDADSGYWCINKKPWGSKTRLDALIEQFYGDVPGWPCRFTRAVPAASGSSAATSRSELNATQAVPAAAGPIWLHGALSTDEAASLVSATTNADGIVDPGTFLVRELPGGDSGVYALCVFYKGKPSHHKIVKDGAFWTVNKRPWGNKTELVDLIEQFYGNVQGWPVKFVNAVPSAGSSGGGGGERGGSGGAETPPTQPAAPRAETPPPQPAAPRAEIPPPQPPPDADAGQATQRQTSNPAWLHGPIDKPTAAQLLSSVPEVNSGTFLVRELPDRPDNYALCVWYKGKPTHHLITRMPDGSGVWGINKKPWGNKTELVDLIEQFFGTVKGWPVPFTLAVPVPIGGLGPTTNADGGRAASPPPPVEPSPPAPPAPAERVPSAGGTTSSDPVWLHGAIDKPTAAELVSGTTNSDGDVDVGTFLVRELPDRPDNYALCVWYKGKPTHHLITRMPDGSGVWGVNKKPWGNKTELVDLIEQFFSPVPGWPVRFVTAVPVPSGGLGPAVQVGGANAGSVPEDAPSDISTTSGNQGSIDTLATQTVSEIDRTSSAWPNRLSELDSDRGSSGAAAPPWLHGEISRADSERMVSGEGSWLVRKRSPFDEREPEYAITVVYKQKATQHHISILNGDVQLNGRSVDGVSTLGMLVDALHTQPPYWPAPLVEFVASETQEYMLDIPRSRNNSTASAGGGSVGGGSAGGGDDGDNAGGDDDDTAGGYMVVNPPADEPLVDGAVLVTLSHTGEGFGIKFEEQPDGGCVIKGMMPGSVSAMALERGLRVGQLVLSINGTDVAGATKAEVTGSMKQATTAELVLREAPAGGSARAVRPSYDNRGGHLQLGGGHGGESTTDAGGADYGDWISPRDVKSAPGGVEAYLAIRPKLKITLRRGNNGDGWGIELSPSTPLAITSIDSRQLQSNGNDPQAAKVGDVVCSINGRSAITDAAGCESEIASATGTNLTLVVARVDVGGLAHQAQQEKNSTRDARSNQGPVHTFAGIRYKLKLDNFEFNVQDMGRWAEEDHFLDNNDFYPDE